MINNLRRSTFLFLLRNKLLCFQYNMILVKRKHKGGPHMIGSQAYLHMDKHLSFHLPLFVTNMDG
jgi:hypothetical protein